MRPWAVLLGLLICCLLTPETAECQMSANMRRMTSFARRPRLSGTKPTPYRFLGTMSSMRYKGLRTRADQIRMASRLRRRYLGALPDLPPIASPIRGMLEERNLLRARSPLGRRATVTVGQRNPLAKDAGTDAVSTAAWKAAMIPPPGESSVAVDPTILSRFGDHLEAQLRAKADENYELGAAYFRAGDLTKARDCFDLVRDLERERPRAFLADVLVSFEREEYNRAIVSLLRALERAQTLDGLKTDGFLEMFYGGEAPRASQRSFPRTVEKVNVFAKSRSDDPRMNLLLAYYAWLNGELATAATAAEAAEKSFKGPEAEDVKRFHAWLTAAGSETATSSPAG